MESYSIKRLEPLCEYRRQVDLKDATVSLIEFEATLEDGTAAGDAGRQGVVAGYNEDDYRATLALRDWLEDRRRDLADRTGEQLPRPFVDEPTRAPEDPEVTRIRSALPAGVSAETSAWTDEERARVLLPPPARPGTWCCWAIRSNWPSRARPRTRRERTPRRSATSPASGALAGRGLTGFGVGTVDKFQGREAPVVIYSMATSSADEVPRGMEFLYDRHRLNVATSRARALGL